MAVTTVAALRELVGSVEAQLGPVQAPLGIVLGSGLGRLASEVEDARRVSYSRLPHLPASTVPGHAGELVVGRWQGRQVIVLSGRVHLYEGNDFQHVALPVRMLAALGVGTLIVTNAAGALHTRWQPGELMLISDHINLQGGSPLTGPNDDRVGPRFPDMSAAYDPQLRALALETAAKVGVPLRQGVYVGLAGPSYETPAEVRMLAQLGGDAVGMSTVPEVIAARHMGVRVLGISCITNLGAGLSAEVLDHAHVGAVAGQSASAMVALLAAVVRGLPELPLRERTF